jgi:hypothetical protein
MQISFTFFLFLLFVMSFILDFSNGKSTQNGIFSRSVYRTSEKQKRGVTKVKPVSAFLELANFLKRYSNKTPFREYSAENICNSIQTLSFSQSYTMKALDGITHRMKNTLKQRYTVLLYIPTFIYVLKI